MILNFRHLPNDPALQVLRDLNTHQEHEGLMLKRGNIADATMVATLRLTKNESGRRAPQMHQTKKSNQWDFGMKRVHQ